LAKYDFVLLEDEPYNEDTFQNGETEFPAVRVTIAARSDFDEDYPDAATFLKNYKTDSALNSEMLLHMQDTGDDAIETSIWFLKQHLELLDTWLTGAQAQRVKTALESE